MVLYVHITHTHTHTHPSVLFSSHTYYGIHETQVFYDVVRITYIGPGESRGI